MFLFILVCEFHNRVMYMKFRYVHLIIHNHIVCNMCSCVFFVLELSHCQPCKGWAICSFAREAPVLETYVSLLLRGSQAHTAEVQCVTQNEARKRNPFT